jgi:hypothetical protein
MELTKDRFIEQFALTFGVHCLRHWSTRLKVAPTYLTTCFYGWIKTNGGQMTLSPVEFAELAEPVIEEVHRNTPKGQRPDAKLVAGRLYDALNAAKVEVALKPFEMFTVAKGGSRARS